jgi:hypothetical protein
MKLAILGLGALVIALWLSVSVMVPKPAPPGSVDQVTLQPVPGGEQRAAARIDAATSDRRRRSSRPDVRRSRATTRRATGSNASPNAQSLSRAERVRRADVTLPGRPPAADSPTVRRRSESAPRSDGSPSPRTTPARGGPAAPHESAPRGEPASVPSEAADPPDPASEPADPPNEPADPPSEPADQPSELADPPDEPETAGRDPVADPP